MVDRPQRERRDLNLPAIERGGRFFTKYEPNIALDIVERIADGELLSKITAADAIPLTITRSTFLRWVASVPELAQAYASARQLSATAFEEKAIDKAEKTAADPKSPQNVSAASLLVGQYRWSAARRNPTTYSDKGNTQIVVPVTINTTLDMGTGKMGQDVEIPDIYAVELPAAQVEEGEFSEVDETGTEDGGDSTSKEITTHERGETIELPTAKEKFRELLRPEVPVIGTSRQPLLQTVKKKTGPEKGSHYKRVLTPRIKLNADR